MPKRGEIWLVKLDPTVGDEMQKTRPCVIISSDRLGTFAVKLIVPLTGWNATFEDKMWHVPVDPTPQNGLRKKSSADTFQTRAVSPNRFGRKLGVLEADVVEEIVYALGIVVEYV